MRLERKCALREDGTVLIMTPREREALVHMAAGLPYVEIAAILGTSRNTLNTYASRLALLAGAHNRHEVAAWAILAGVVTSSEIAELWRVHRPDLAAWLMCREEGA